MHVSGSNPAVALAAAAAIIHVASGVREGAVRWRRWLAKTPPRSCLHAAHWEREARNLPVANHATTRWWMRGGGECAAECVATEAARRRRGQHVALNVICRRGMRPEAEDCSRQGCSRARSHHHLGWARHRRTPTPPGMRAWPPRQGVHALAFLLQLSYLTQVFECEHNKYAGLHSDATCSSAAPRRVSHLASASRNCSQRSVAL